MYHIPRNPFNATRATDSANDTAHRIFRSHNQPRCTMQAREQHTLASWLISRSNSPTFVFG